MPQVKPLWRCGAALMGSAGLLIPRLARATDTGTASDVAPASAMTWSLGLLAAAALAAWAWQLAARRRRDRARTEQPSADHEWLALIARKTSNAVLITDRSLHITWVNDAFTQLYGYTRERARGMTPDALLGHPDGDPLALEQLRLAAEAGRACRVEILNRAADGRDVWVDTEVQPALDSQGRVLGFVEIATDITASKRAITELAVQRRRLASIIEGTQAGTWEWNVETGESRLNDRWAEIVGYSLAELAPPSIENWRRLAHPEDLIRSDALFERHFSGELSTYECEARMRHKAGHWVWVLARGKLITRTPEGRPRWAAGTHLDISERKQAEAALRASQALLDRTGRIGGVGGWSYDLASQAIEWTDQTCRIHGVEPGHRPTLEEALSYFEPEGRFALEQAIRHSLATGAGYDLELPFVTAGGERIWVRAVGQTEFVDGKAVRMLGALQEITTRREMESELRRNNEVLASVLENLPCGLSVFDGDGLLVAENTQFRSLLHLPDNLFDGRCTRFEDIIRHNAEHGEYGPDDIEDKIRAIVDRASSPIVQHQFERVRPDGSTLEIRGGPLPAGGFVTTYTDISARRSAEAEVQRSVELLRGAIDTIDEAFVLYDPADRLVFCNDKYRQIYATSADLIVPGATFEQIVRRGAERGQYAAAVGRVDAWVAERMAVHRAGNATLLQRLDDGRTLRIIERRMPDGHIVGFRIDITELVRATEAAQQASQAKSRFLANMSHEIRTPMNAVLGLLSLLSKTELASRQTDYVVKTERAARSLLGLLDDILDFSKVEAGKMTLDPQPFDLDQLLRDLSVILSANVGSKRVELLFDIDPALPPQLVGDAPRLQQVLINLAGNAIKFTATGEVVLQVVQRERGADRVGLHFAVRDTGIGIAPENQAQIFSGFTQAEASTTRRFGGTGLGVAISQRLVALMGGELRLDSAPGRGSRFHFDLTLPLASQPDEPLQAQVRPNRPAAPLRALVVDDHPGARDVLARLCRSLGWQADLADSGEQALALLQARAAEGAAHQAVFVDWQMPGLDGWQTCQHIRALGPTGTAPLIAMATAHDREQLWQRSATERAVIDGCLVKPITASMLRDAVDLAVTDVRPARLAPPLTGSDRKPGARRLAGLHLLLVEDNPTNQQVARELLQHEGAQVQIANHGLEAIEALAAAGPPFDLVLMDIQMPVMDGYTAARRIREQLGLSRLPIVAMTANAMETDRQACLAAGMNEHVGKPFDLAHLVQVLLRQTGRPDAPTAGAPPPAADRPAPENALSQPVRVAAAVAGVNLPAALGRLGGNLAIYRRMLAAFTADLAGARPQLQTLAEQGDLASAARLLHTLKGVAATLGADTLARTIAQGEPLADPITGQETDATAAWARIEPAGLAIAAAGPALAALHELLHEWLQQSRQDGPAGSPGPGDGVATGPAATDPAELRAALRDLTNLLLDSDMAAIESLAQLRHCYGALLGERLHVLDDAIAQLDFGRAVRECHHLLQTDLLP